MWLLLIVVVWVAVSAWVTYPYVEEIEKLEKTSDKVFSYILFLLVAPLMVMVGSAVEELERMGIDMGEDDDGDE